MILIRKWLQQNRVFFSLYAILTTFATYFCVYGYRKAFSVASFKGFSVMGIDLKVFLVITQVLGYTLAKFIGIKVVSELSYKKRTFVLVLLVLMAELSLLLFALIPFPYNVLFLFFNGLSLGMIWGIIFGYLEGRFNTELLGVGLATSFIVASGFVKSVGKYLMVNFSVGEFQMPFVTGLLFLPIFLLLAYLLNQIPQPSPAEEEIKAKRVPMTSSDRMELLKKFVLGIIFLTVTYMLLSAYRDLRDNFAVEIWSAVGYKNQPSIFTLSEIPIAIVVPIILSFIVFIKSNRNAIFANLVAILMGFVLVGLSTFLYQSQVISPVVCMISFGFGLYLGYVPFNCILFDRLVALHHSKANASFLINIADSFGYSASIGVLLFKNFGQTDISWYSFFLQSGYVISIIGIALSVASLLYFLRKGSFTYSDTGKSLNE
jgi:hypothetical protein